MKTGYGELVREMREISVLSSIGSVLGWDERTGMPAKGAGHRGDQAAMVAGMVHSRFTSKKIGELIEKSEGEVKGLGGSSVEGANVREVKRRYGRQKKLPSSLVEEISRTTVMSEQAWAGARKANDYGAFKPWLGKMYDLKHQEIACYGIETEAYDALLEDYEPGEKAANLRVVFEGLRGPLVELVGKIGEASKRGRAAPMEVLMRKYPAGGQERFARKAAAAIGFDFEGGALAVSTHPFCSGMGPGDVRMTTRYDEEYFGDAFFGVLHESGHALYEQGLPGEHYGLPAGEAISLGIHESQSRMWENLVGRSRSFWRHFMPGLREEFPDATKGVSDDEWYRAVNDVRPSLIRVESDEATYNLHILLRFELETALLEKTLGVDDLPGAWAEKMKKYLGIEVPSDREGCMQDVHWSAGLVGYFPTYTLGNLYSAQFFEQARKDLGDLDGMFARGEFAPLLGWLRKNIHAWGQRLRAPELVEKVTGRGLSAEPLLKHLRSRAAEVYGV